MAINVVGLQGRLSASFRLAFAINARYRDIEKLNHH